MLPAVGMPYMPVFEDNEGTVQLAQNPITNSDSKHINVRHHFLRELVERKEVPIVHVPSQFQHADFLTEAIARHSCDEFVGLIIFGCFWGRLILKFRIIIFFFHLCIEFRLKADL